MRLQRLLIQNFRNLELIDFAPGPAFNLITGSNGAGKTSILEAISYLALARSFRSSNIHYLITHGKPAFNIFAQVREEEDVPFASSIGISRGRKAQDLKIKVNGEPITALSELVAHICVQVIHPQGIELLTGGPELRRHFMDWGVYYAESSYKQLYAQYVKVLKQRNALLKTNVPADHFAVWDDMLCELSLQITQLRQNYIAALDEALQTITGDFLPDFKLSFELSSGCENGDSMRSALASSLEKDRVLGYTSQGCHRADLKVKSNALAAGAMLSRGQLKLLVCAMRMAQSLLLKAQTGRSCIFLIDDLNSELDRHSQEVLLTHLEQCRNQVFITNIVPDLLFSDLSRQKIIALSAGRLVPV